MQTKTLASKLVGSLATAGLIALFAANVNCGSPSGGSPDLFQGAADMSMATPDLTMQAASLTVTGDAASTYSSAMLTSFTCPNNPNNGPSVQSPLPDNFGMSSPLHGVPLTLFVLPKIIWVTDSLGKVYYQSSNTNSFGVPGATGTVNNVVLNGEMGNVPPIPGTLTVNGTWKCP